MRPWTADEEDAAAASGFDTDTAVEAFIFDYLGAIHAAVEDVAGNPGHDFDEGADPAVRPALLSAETIMNETRFI